MIIEIIVCFILFLFVVPVKLNFSLYLNLLKNRGALSVRVGNVVNAVQDKFFIANGELTATNPHNKQKTIELKKDDQEVVFLNILSQTIYRKTIFDNIEVFFDMGKKDDAFATTMWLSSFKILSEIALSILKNQKSGVFSNVYCNPMFKTNKISIVISVVCWTNLFDLIFSLAKSKLKAMKRIKEMKKQAQYSQTM